TLSATNHAGVAGTISVVADDGAGGRATNTFTATTVADATIEAPFLYPVTVTNLVAPANTPLTNYVFGCDFPGVTNNWYVQFADANSFQDASNSFFKVVTNQLMLVMVPDTNYAGPVRCNVYVSGSPAFSSYDVQNYTFAFGDTAIAATAGNFEAEALTPITNCLLARFTNGVPGAAPANFSASINWGDNTISSGLIVTNPAGWKEVRGTHTYTNAGNYPVYVTLQSALGASATMVSTGSVPPSLTLTRTATNDLVGWPAWATDYQLQSNTNPALADWTAVTNFPALSGYRSVVRDSPTGGTVFYRLKK
ncbi:MAG: hypothetical protein KGR98_14960, partial [Verrucomicrobia bacterium]|nr:hypothetical protein [Verrucomicrobiota bacterium]